MAKQFRKAKRRPSREHQEQVEDDRREADIAELWDVLTENRRGTWWHIPWREGTNVVELCLLVNKILAPGAESLLDAVEFLRRFVATRDITQYTYWRAQEFIEVITPTVHYAHERFLVCGMRALQLTIANSHGGGHVFNDLLSQIWRYAPADAERIVREIRCKDALGIDGKFDNSMRDRWRRAFYTAWDRGLYEVAYAVGVSK